MSNITPRFATAFWSGTGVGTNAGVTVTQAGAAGKVQVVSGIDCSGDAAAIVTIESPSGTVLWRKRFAAAFNTSVPFPDGSIAGPSAAAVLVKVSASTSNSEANIYGYTVNG